jgi:hypothetical protein
MTFTRVVDCEALLTKSPEELLDTGNDFPYWLDAVALVREITIW